MIVMSNDGNLMSAACNLMVFLSSQAGREKEALRVFGQMYAVNHWRSSKAFPVADDFLHAACVNMNVLSTHSFSLWLCSVLLFQYPTASCHSSETYRGETVRSLTLSYILLQCAYLV